MSIVRIHARTGELPHILVDDVELPTPIRAGLVLGEDGALTLALHYSAEQLSTGDLPDVLLSLLVDEQRRSDADWLNAWNASGARSTEQRANVRPLNRAVQEFFGGEPLNVDALARDYLALSPARRLGVLLSLGRTNQEEHERLSAELARGAEEFLHDHDMRVFGWARLEGKLQTLAALVQAAKVQAVADADAKAASASEAQLSGQQLVRRFALLALPTQYQLFRDQGIDPNRFTSRLDPQLWRELRESGKLDAFAASVREAEQTEKTRSGQ